MDTKSLLLEQLLFYNDILKNEDASMSSSSTMDSDLKDVIKAAINILQSFIYNSKNNYLEMDVFYQNEMKTKFSINVDREHRRVEILCNHLNALKRRLDELEFRFDEKLKALNNVNKKEEENLAKTNDTNFFLFCSKLNEELEQKKEDVNMAYYNFDQYLAKQMENLSKSYQQKFQQITDDNTQLQLSLQTRIHDKHTSKVLMQEKISEEEKRFALAHEEISRTFTEKEDKFNERFIQMNQKIKEIHLEMERDKTDSNGKLLKLEKKLLDDYEKKKQMKNDKMLELDQKQLEMSKKISTLNFEKEKLTVQSEIDRTNIADQFVDRISKENEKTKEIIIGFEEEIQKSYQPKIKMISESIQSLVLQKNEHEIEQRKLHYSLMRGNEEEVIELMKKNEEELKEMRLKLKEKKKEFEKLKTERKNDLNALKSMNQQRLGKAMQGLDLKANKTAIEISEVMKEFDVQQSLLFDLQERSIEDRDVKRMKRISRIREDHDRRKNDLIRQYDEIREKQANEKYTVESQSEEEKHKNDVQDVQNRIMNSKGKMDILQLKIDGFMKIQQAQIDDLKKRMPELFNENLTDENGKPLEPTKVVNEVEQRIKYVNEEANDLKQEIVNMQYTFDQKMQRMEENYTKTRIFLNIETKKTGERVNHLQSQIENQHEKIEVLDRVASAKVTEVEDFETSYEDKKNEFETITRSTFQENLDNAKQPSIDFENQMKELKESFAKSIEDLREQLDDAKQMTGVISQTLLNEREKKLKETELTMRLTHEQKMSLMKENHEKRMGQMEAELEAKRTKAKKSISVIETDYQTLLNENETKFKETKEQMETNRFELSEETKILDDKIEFEKNKECCDCNKKKEIIELLLRKKKILEEKLGIHNQERLKNEVKMNEIFQAPNRIISPPPIVVSKTTLSSSNLLSPPPMSRKIPLNFSTPQRPMTAIGAGESARKISARRPKTANLSSKVKKLLPFCTPRLNDEKI